MYCTDYFWRELERTKRPQPKKPKKITPKQRKTVGVWINKEVNHESIR